MSAPRTVTILTADHGPVVVLEPSWCLGEHEDGGARVDITHVGADHALTLPTREGLAVLLLSALESRPFVADPFLRLPFMSVCFDGAGYETGLPGLEAMAAALEAGAEQLRERARELAIALAEGRAR